MNHGAAITWAIPGSKSITNRALLLAALSRGTSRLTNVLRSDDTDRMADGLRLLGIEVNDDGRTTVVDGGDLQVPPTDLFVGNSGTTVRFLAAAATLVPGPVTLVGDEHMAKRPIGDLVDGLRQLGVDVNCPTGCPPLNVHGGVLPEGKIAMRGDRSSQYFSALMMAAVGASGPVEIHVIGELVSRPYVRMTMRMIEDFGGSVEERDDGSFVIHPIGRYEARDYVIEPDASAASYAFAYGAATGRSVRVPGLTRSSLQGDVGFVDVLARMGCAIDADDDGITVTGPAPGTLRGLDVDLFHLSDTVMSLAAIAPLATGPTTIRNIANIRIKETDRLAALVTELRRLGQGVEYGDDWLRITPAPIVAATIECYADHRMAMSFGVLGAALEHLGRPVRVGVQDRDCVAKTYPEFWADLAAVRALT